MNLSELPEQIDQRTLAKRMVQAGVECNCRHLATGFFKYNNSLGELPKKRYFFRTFKAKTTHYLGHNPKKYQFFWSYPLIPENGKG